MQYRPLQVDEYELRLLTMDDCGNFLDLVNRNRERISTYFPGIVSHCDSIDQLRKHLEERIAESPKGKYAICLIFGPSDGKPIGVIQLKDIDWNAMKRELGYFIDKDYENKGIMSRCIITLLDQTFNEQDLNKVFLRIDIKNTASRKMAEKCGFRQEGLMLMDFKTYANEYVDSVYYGLLKKDFQK